MESVSVRDPALSTKLARFDSSERKTRNLGFKGPHLLFGWLSGVVGNGCEADEVPADSVLPRLREEANLSVFSTGELDLTIDSRSERTSALNASQDWRIAPRRDATVRKTTSHWVVRPFESSSSTCRWTTR